nr:CPBP family intramembrane glutamic endopeptidase [Formosa haliotis]
MNAIGRILLLIIPYFIIVGIFQLTGMAICGVDYMDLDAIKTSKQEFIIMLFTCIGTAVVLWIFMKYIDKERFVNLGFQLKNRAKDINVGVLLGLVIMGLGYLVLWGLNEIQYSNISFNITDIFYAILVFFLVSVSEEMLFRGYVLRNLLAEFNPFISLIVSSFYLLLCILQIPTWIGLVS